MPLGDNPNGIFFILVNSEKIFMFYWTPIMKNNSL